jgi:NTE family protein
MDREAKTALVLSAGGMFGAYQAGAWEALEGRFPIDMVVGASIGALNGWAIAAGATARELRERWLALSATAALRYRFPWPPLSGVVDATGFEAAVGDVWNSYSPVCPVGIVLTDLKRLKPVLYTKEKITWEHLAASCAVPGGLPARRLEGRWYVDGGLLNALPVWAASQMGATRVLAVNAWAPAGWMSFPFKVLKLRRGAVPRPAAALEVARIGPAGRLGGLRDAFVWNRQRTEGWYEQGRRDAAAWLGGCGKNNFHVKCFERQ